MSRLHSCNWIMPLHSYTQQNFIVSEGLTLRNGLAAYNRTPSKVYTFSDFYDVGEQAFYIHFVPVSYKNTFATFKTKPLSKFKTIGDLTYTPYSRQALSVTKTLGMSTNINIIFATF